MSQVASNGPHDDASADPGTSPRPAGNVPTVAATGGCTVVSGTDTRCEKEGTEDVWDGDIDDINNAWIEPGHELMRDTDGKAYMCENHMWMTEAI